MSEPFGVNLTKNDAVLTTQSSQTAANSSQLANAVANAVGTPEYTPTTTSTDLDKIKKERESVFKSIADEYGISENDLYKFLEKIGYTKEKLFSKDEDFTETSKIIISIISQLKYTSINKNKNKTQILNNIADKINKILAENPNLKLKDIASIMKSFGEADLVGTFKLIFKNIDDSNLKNKLNNVKTLSDKDASTGQYIITDNELEQLIAEYFNNDKNNKVSKIDKFNQFIAILQYKIDDNDTDTYNRLYNAFKNFALKDERFAPLFKYTEKLKEATDVHSFLVDCFGKDKVAEMLQNPQINANELIGMLTVVKNALGAGKPIPQDCIQNLLEAFEPLIEKYAELKAKSNDPNQTLTKEEQIEFDKMNAFIAFIMSEGNEEQKNKALGIAQNAGTLEDIYKILFEISQENPNFNIQEKIDKLTDGAFSQYVNERIIQSANEKQSEFESKYTNSGIGFSQGNFSNYQSALNGSDYGIIYNNAETQFTLDPTLNSFSASDSQTAIRTLSFKELDSLVKNGMVTMSKILKECKSTLNNAIGQVAFNYMNKLNSTSLQAYYLGFFGSNEVKKTMIEECDYDYNKLAPRVDLTINIKQELEQKAKEKDNLYPDNERSELT